MLQDNDPFYLERFIVAQSGQLVNSSYETALREIREEHKKSSHWMWYVFPQLKCLCHSWYSKFYGITSIDEAKAYLSEPLLCDRLIEISKGLLNVEQPTDISDIMGSPDDRKLQSSMTLFHYANPDIAVFSQVLRHFYGGAECQKTVEFLLERQYIEQEDDTNDRV